MPDPRTAGLVRLDVADGLAEWLVRCVALAAGELGGRLEDVAVAGPLGCSPGEVAGLNVATDSIAPATRHTARMLASSGMTLPRAAKGANGPASRRSRLRRRSARSSRW
ncbi:MAG TPA: hypothetical protein VMK84_05365 [Streptosporangiaceae bacterium]|nr:hypothetical protein [Streptosporangiaceae bacterium]